MKGVEEWIAFAEALHGRTVGGGGGGGRDGVAEMEAKTKNDEALKS